jgi:hypothetical protein
VPTAETLAELTAERFNIEKDEPPIYRALDLLCHNELAIAQGKRDPANLAHLPKWMSMTANLIRWDTNSLKSQAEYEDAKRMKSIPPSSDKKD